MTQIFAKNEQGSVENVDKVPLPEVEKIPTFWNNTAVPKDFTGVCFTESDKATHHLVNGQYHRTDGPAYLSDSSKVWFVNGKHHRLDGPSVEHADGRKYWYINGSAYIESEFIKEITRRRIEEENEAAKVAAYAKELKFFEEKTVKLQEQLLRMIKKVETKTPTLPVFRSMFEIPHDFTGTCTLESINAQVWFQDRMVHRLDGPAVMFFNGKKEWWINGVNLTEEMFNKHPSVTQKKLDDVFEDGNAGVDLSKFGFKTGKKESLPEDIKLPEMKGLQHFPNIYHAPFNFVGWASIGDIKRICRLEKGSYHNLDGPAAFDYENESKHDYYVKGVHLSKKEFFGHPDVIAHKAKPKEAVSVPLDTVPSVPTLEQPLNPFAEKWGAFLKNPSTATATSYNPVFFRADTSGTWYSVNQQQPLNQEKQKDMSSTLSPKTVASEFLATLKSDGKEAAKRTAARKLTKIAQEFLVNLMTSGVKGKQLATMKDSIRENLNTEHGKAVLGITMGSILPQFKQMLPEKHHSLVDEMSTEFRVEGLSVVGDIVTEFVTGPAFSMLQSSVVGVFEDLSTENPKVRVAGDLTAPASDPKLDTADEREAAKASALRR